jgi:tetratricopeptide (TPR) repeat protein
MEVQPQYFENYHRLGAYYFDQGDYDTAVEQLKKMVELTPELAEAHYALAAPYLNMADYKDAEIELNRALDIQPNYANAVMGLGLSRLYQEKNHEAIPFFQEAIRIGPATSLYYVDLGTAFRRSRSKDKANQAYKKGWDLAKEEVKRNPSDAYERAWLSYLCASLEDPDRAAFEIQQALDFSKKFEVRWIALLTYEVLGEHGRALDLLQDVPRSMFVRISRNPDLVQLRANTSFQQLDHHNQYKGDQSWR